MTEKFKRRILVCVTGMTPQVVTETLYALLEEGTVPTEVQLITTEDGRNCALRDLLDSQTGQFHALCRDTNCTGKICFDRDSIHVIDDAAGKPLSDIRTPEDNNRAADLIVRLLQSYCSDDDSAVYVSLAGGRKTMGFFAGYALSLFGRSQDRLLHVLVSPPFEGNREFFYPTQSLRFLQGGILDASQAKVAMADIPFVRLRGCLTETVAEDLQTGKAGYVETVTAVQKQLTASVEVSFDKKNTTLMCGGIPVKLEPACFATYLWLAWRCKSEMEAVNPNSKEAVAEFLEVYKWVVGDGSGHYDIAYETSRDLTDFVQYFREKRSVVSRKIKAKFKKEFADPYLIESNRKRGEMRYQLKLVPEQITLPDDQRWRHMIRIVFGNR